MSSDEKPRAPLPPGVGAPRGYDDEDVDADDATLMASIDDMEAAKGDPKAASDIRAAREKAKRALSEPSPQRITIPPERGSSAGMLIGVVILLIAVAVFAFFLAKATAPKAPPQPPATPAKS